MALYGLKDAANCSVFSKATGLPVMFINYANATSSEFSSESVYATAKGANAIRWDNARTGTLTLDSEIFDLALLAMAMGSDVTEGKADWLNRVVGEIDDSKVVELEAKGEIDPETISVVKVKSDLVEQEGMPLQQTGAAIKLPGAIANFAISANDTSAKITFDKLDGATAYVITRDGQTVEESATNSFTDSGLEAATEYTYTVAAKNAGGVGPASAEIRVTTPAEGTTEFSNFEATPEAIAAAAKNVGTPVAGQTEEVTFSFEGNKVTFSEKAVKGDHYAIFFMEKVEKARTLTVNAEKYPGNYEVFADSVIREKESGVDQVVQIHYPNAKPQSNFTLTQSATEPTSLSIVFDLFPDENQNLAEFKVID